MEDRKLVDHIVTQEDIDNHPELSVEGIKVGDIIQTDPENAPEATAPEATAPEATAPEATAPEATAPEATAPEAVSKAAAPKFHGNKLVVSESTDTVDGKAFHNIIDADGASFRLNDEEYNRLVQ